MNYIIRIQNVYIEGDLLKSEPLSYDELGKALSMVLEKQFGQYNFYRIIIQPTLLKREGGKSNERTD